MGLLSTELMVLPEQAAVDRPVSRVELIERLLPGNQLVSDHSVIGGAEDGVGGHGALDADLPIRKVGRSAGLRVIEERALLEQIARQRLGIGDRRLEILDLLSEGGETVLGQEGDAVGEEVPGGAVGSAKALDAVVGVAVFARRLVINRAAGADHGLRVELVGHAQPRTKSVHPGVAEVIGRAVGARINHRPGNSVERSCRTSRAEVAVVEMPFLFGNGDFVAQAEVQCQLRS